MNLFTPNSADLKLFKAVEIDEKMTKVYYDC